MILIRPCRAGDLAGIEAVVNANTTLISSVPHDREKLSERIDHSRRSFEQDPDVEGGEFFLFVMEDTESGEILGTSGISMNRDRSRPFYSYRFDELIHSSPKLGVHSAVPVLYLTHELTGKSVLCGLSVRESLRDTEYFELLSRSRLLFMRQFRDLFSDEVVVEMQGVHEDKNSAFWDSLGRHFFNLDFATADYYSSIKSRTFIAEMMPQHPIYVSLLSEEAQAVIGQVDPGAEPAHRLLLREGFKASPYFDIFDGGPTLKAELDSLQSLRLAKDKQARCGQVYTGVRYLVSNQSFEDFRCSFAQITDGMGDIIRLDSTIADSLNIADGDTISYVTL